MIAYFSKKNLIKFTCWLKIWSLLYKFSCFEFFDLNCQFVWFRITGKKNILLAELFKNTCCSLQVSCISGGVFPQAGIRGCGGHVFQHLDVITIFRNGNNSTDIDKSFCVTSIVILFPLYLDLFQNFIFKIQNCLFFPFGLK